MNRAERRAAMKGKKGKANAPSPEVIIAQARKSRDGLCFVLGILGCVLAGLWGYMAHNYLAYILAGCNLIYALSFGMRILRNRKR